MPRPAALVALAFALAACDSGDPTEDDLVGTWSLVSVTSRDLVTVSRTQDILDASQPTEGALTLDGSESGRLEYVSYVSRYGAGVSFNVLSFDPNGSPYPPVRRHLNVSDSPEAQYTQLYVEGDTIPATFYTYRGEGRAPIAREGWTYRFDDVPLQTDPYGEPSRTARVSGALTFGHRTLTADTPTPFNEYVYPADASFRLTYVFRSGGDLLVRETYGNRTVEQEGRWERDGDVVRLSRPLDVEGSTETLTYRVRREGPALVFVNDVSPYPCDASCREGVAYSYGLEPGTVRRFVNEVALQFRSGEAPGTKTAAAAALRPVPPSVRERLLLGPVP
jgi:hypothetical protein